jgi:ferrous iron transport protein A
MSRLHSLKRGQKARIRAFHGDSSMEEALREIGFAEGDEVEILERGLVNGSPLSIRLDRTILALRKSEAACIEIEAD